MIREAEAVAPAWRGSALPEEHSPPVGRADVVMAVYAFLAVLAASPEPGHP